MPRRSFSSSFLLLLASLGCISSANAAPRPNFLLIVADDLCWRDLGFTGNAEVQTPHLDRLRKEGMMLRRMYNVATSCSPTRHALYTGLYPVRSGAYPNHTRVDETTRSLFTHLKTLGYRVGLLGKSHVSPASSFPFETIGRSPDDIAALAKFMGRDSAQPWFAVLASNDPHSPWSRGPKRLYDPKTLTVPPYFHDNANTRANLADYYAEITQLDSQVGAALQALEKLGQNDQTLVMFVSEQGSSFPYGGKWTLYENGIRAAALVRWPGRVKANSSSDALMQYVDVAPTFVAAAGGNPEKIDTGCPNPVGGSGFDGQSFLAVIGGETEQFRDFAYAQHTTLGLTGQKVPYPSRTVCDGRFKLIANLTAENKFTLGRLSKGGKEPWRSAEIMDSWRRDAGADPTLASRIASFEKRPPEELYDLHVDPYEMRNLAADPAYAKILGTLRGKLTAWMEQQGDTGLPIEMKALSRRPLDDGDEDEEKPKPKKAKSGATK